MDWPAERAEEGARVDDEEARRVHASCVGILDAAGTPVGTGIILAPDLVATCAHVVADAVGGDPEATDPPNARMTLRRHGAAAPSDRPVEGSAAVVAWSPIRADGTGDIALLRTVEPLPDPSPPPLHRGGHVWGHRFAVHPWSNMSAGGRAPAPAATGELRAAQALGWIQLEVDDDSAAIGEGASGAAVWDLDAGAVTGMTVAAAADPDRTTAYLIPIEHVLALAPEVLTNPYRGLEPFGEADAALFCGRDAEVERLCSAVESRALVAVAGRTGSGKSSLVRAGLFPRLRAAGVGLHEVRPVLTGEQAGLSPIVAALRRSANTDPYADDLIFIDQFEELVAADPATARDLLALLAEEVDSTAYAGRLRVVLTMRWDAWDELLSETTRALLTEGTLAVPPMDRAQLRSAVLGPLGARPGVEFDAGLVERILDDAGDQPGGLPLVEVLLTQLWEHRDGLRLRAESYDEIGGVAGAVAERAERTLPAVTGDGTGATTEGDVRRLLSLFARPGEEDRFVRAPVALDRLSKRQRELVDRLAAQRLLVLGHDGDREPYAELAHQAVIDHWPRLRRWLIADQDFLRWRADLDRRAARWVSDGRDDAALLRRGELATAQGWVTDRADQLAPTGRELIEASSRHARRGVRRYRAVVGVLAGLALVAAGLTVASIVTGHRIDAANTELGTRLATVNARALATRSDQDAGADLSGQVQFALAAWRADPASAEAATALGRAALATASTGRVLGGVSDRPIKRLEGSDDGRTVLVPRRSGYAVVTGLPDRPTTRALPDMPDGAGASLSPDGRYVGALDADGTGLVWDLRARSGPRRMAGQPGAEPTGPGAGRSRRTADGPRFSADSRRLLALHDSGGRRLRIWDAVSGRPIEHAVDALEGTALGGVWQTSDPDRVLIRYADGDAAGGRLVVRRLSTGEAVHAFDAGGTVARRGATVLRCTSTGSGSAARAELRAAASDTGETSRSIPLPSAESCAGAGPASIRVSADEGYLVRDVSLPAKNHATVEAISLSDGRGYELLTRPWAEDSGGPRTVVDAAGPLGVASELTLAPSRSGPPRLAVAAGRSLQLVDPPRPTPPADALASTSDGTYVVARSGSSVRTHRVADGAQVASRSLREGADHLTVIGDRLLVTGTAPRSGAEVTAYTLPRLRLESRVRLPSTQTSEAPTLDVSGDRMTAVAGALVSSWDLRGGRQLGDPRPTDGAVEVAARPRHPNHVARVRSDGTTEVWDPRRHRRIAWLNTTMRTDGKTSERFRFDPSGERLAYVDRAGAIQVWNVDARAPERPPLPAPDVLSIAGFTADGSLVLTLESPRGASDLQNAVSIVDVDTGERIGPLAPDHTSALGPAVTGSTVRLGHGVPVGFPLRTESWFERLCRVQDRPFTETERAGLPGGSSSQRPCHGGG